MCNNLFWYETKAHWEPSQTSKKDFFYENSQQLQGLTISQKTLCLMLYKVINAPLSNLYKKGFWKCSRQGTFLFAPSSWANSRKALGDKSTEKYLAFPANIYLFKVNNRNTTKKCEICSELTIIFTVDLEQILHLLKIFYYWLWTDKCWLGCRFWHSHIPVDFQEIFRIDPAGIFLCIDNNRNTRTRCKVCSKVDNKDTRTISIMPAGEDMFRILP